MPGHGGHEIIAMSVDQTQLRHVAATLRSMADGKELGKALRADLRAATKPVVSDLKASILAAPGATQASPGLRQTVASKIVVQIRTVGGNPSVAVRAKKTPAMRGFYSAAKNFNAPKFRHPVMGDTSRWVDQVGKPRWFDDTTAKHRHEFHRAAMKAIEKFAREAARRMKGQG